MSRKALIDKAVAAELLRLADEIHRDGGTNLTALWAADTIRLRAYKLRAGLGTGQAES